VINFHKLPIRHSLFFVQIQALFSSLFICPGEFNSHILFAGKAHLADLRIAKDEVIKLQNVLGGDYLSLLDRFENITPT
jgi:hypothetical protein